MRMRASDEYPPRSAETVHRTGACSKLGLYSQFLPRHRDSRDALGSNEDFGLTRIKLVAL